jgi:7-carboxy-7-deazaguanine synthase
MENTQPKKYMVNEIFCSVQGEGMRAGTLNHFVRFSGCNLQCTIEPGPLSPGGFDCDTEFVSGRKMVAEEILEEIRTINPKCKSIIFTGGEPLLQLDLPLVQFFKRAGYYLAVETNGSKPLPEGVSIGSEINYYSSIDWVTCSPKVAEHAVRLEQASEVKYVRGYGQGIPRPTCKAPHKLISPAFIGMTLDTRSMDWCMQLVNENPDWRLSLQLHKFIAIR